MRRTCGTPRIWRNRRTWRIRRIQLIRQIQRIWRIRILICIQIAQSIFKVWIIIIVIIGSHFLFSREVTAKISIQFLCEVFQQQQQAVFDCLSQSLLIVHAYGFNKASTEYLKHYLSHRKLKIKIYKTFSKWAIILHGVPQGSI